MTHNGTHTMTHTHSHTLPHRLNSLNQLSISRH